MKFALTSWIELPMSQMSFSDVWIGWQAQATRGERFLAEMEQVASWSDLLRKPRQRRKRSFPA